MRITFRQGGIITGLKVGRSSAIKPAVDEEIMVGKKIMVVDDSASARAMVIYSLLGGDYDVVEAVDGENAIEKLRDGAVDMIITDVHMPRLDGIELVRRIRNNPEYSSIPIILLTIESQETKKREGIEAGATAWIVKPFTPDLLITMVKAILSE